ncbi:hypothetical protein [uncultured Winogradskyella sp.]|uniref:hypothetical protein n=1 Tax=uncultured Winogradskyella sp. TaxID=395353 RepID=UPI00261AFC78|nr:hypothetical protein [uncultured Winogradskyella sp.]
MESLKKFENLSLANTKDIFGGKELKTEQRNDANEVLYTDSHHDNDNDGKWSCGDTFTLTKV